MTTRLPIISVASLSHTYGEGNLARRIFKDISTEFFPGEITIIMGPSGAGKTTFLSLLGALRSVQSGSVQIAGKELQGMKPEELVQIRRRIGFIFQSQNLLDSLTACQNVQLGLVSQGETGASSAEKARLLLAEVGLREHLHKLPRQLSGGQRQRVAIARALIREPEVIMADEPTAALDSQTGRDVVDLLHHLARKKGCAILLVTHDNRILDLADRIIRIEDGVMEETQLGMDRLEAELQKLAALLTQYPASFLGSTSISSLRPVFDQAAVPLSPWIAELTRARMSESIDRRAGALKGQFNALVSLEATLADTAHYLNVLELPELAESFVQTLEFLLLTAEEAARLRQPDIVHTLLGLTGDRGQIMEGLHERYERRNDLTRETKRALFDVTTSFSRNVYFLNQLASHLFEAGTEKTRRAEQPSEEERT